VRLASFIPDGFGAYVRVFQPVEEARGSARVPRSWAEIGAERGVALSPDVSFAEVIGSEGQEWTELLSLTSGPSRGGCPPTAARSWLACSKGTLRPRTSARMGCGLDGAT